MPSYDALKNKKAELIRKALDGSGFIAPIDASPISSLTQNTGAATAAILTAAADAVNIVTAGNLVVSLNNQDPVTVALAAADTPAQVVTKLNTAFGTQATASLSGSKVRITSALVGGGARVRVVSGTGSVLTNLGFTAGATANGNNPGITLNPLPALWDDIGFLTSDGAQFSRDISSSEVTSWGSTTPTRTDVTSDTSTLTIVAQETKLLTIGLATGADLSAVTPTAGTGEVSVAKPSRPKGRYYRALSVAVDQGDFGEIYIARFLPRAKVSGYAEQSFGGGDEPVTWGVTFTGEEDSSLGYSERWIFGGAGWYGLLAKMGFPTA